MSLKYLNKRNFKIIVHLKIVFLGFILFVFNRKYKTNEHAYMSLIRLFCLTQGRLLDFFSKIISIINPPKIDLELCKKSNIVFFENLNTIDSQIKENGYFVFPNKLPDEYIQELLLFATTKRCRPRETDKNILAGEKTEYVDFYPRKNPGYVRYDFSENDLINEKIVQKIIFDFGLMAIAQNYLNATPILDIVTMWWHTAYSSDPDKEAAQFYHFDMDRVKWLKFFFYLTDVDSDTGPHCFISKTHNSGEIPGAILKKGYSRLTDEEVSKYYEKDRFIEFLAPQGTIIAEDTRGLHKGKHVVAKDRLMFQIQFCNSLFGTTCRKHKISTKHLNNVPDHIFKKVFLNFI